jgi:hypothetical protein
MNFEKQKEYYLGIFYKDIFIAFMAKCKYYNIDFENYKGGVYRWTNCLDYAELFWLYESDVKNDNQYHIRNLKEFYYRTSAGYKDLLRQDYDKNNGMLVAFLRPNFHNICQDQLHFKYLSKQDIEF